MPSDFEARLACSRRYVDPVASVAWSECRTNWPPTLSDRQAEYVFDLQTGYWRNGRFLRVCWVLL